MNYTVGQLITELSKFKSELPVVIHNIDSHLVIDEAINEWFPDTDRVVLYAGAYADEESPAMRTETPTRRLRSTRSSIDDLVAKKVREREGGDGT